MLILCFPVSYNQHILRTLLIGKNGAVLSILQWAHVDAVEVDTPVGSSPGGNKAITVFARGRQGGACGC